MNLQRFFDESPDLFDGWRSPAPSLRAATFQTMLARVRGMTSAGVLQLLNHAVACLEPDEAYGEVGSFQGATLIGALFGHPDCRAYAVDNFSEFDPQGSNHARLKQNLADFGLSSQVRFALEDFQAFLLALRTVRPRLGVYLYDGAHDYRSQVMGLLLATSLLAERALVIVDDANFAAVKQATRDFLAVCPEARLVLDLPTAGNGQPTFWNGILALSWTAGQRNESGAGAPRPASQSALLESLYTLQQVNVAKRNGVFHLAPVN